MLRWSLGKSVKLKRVELGDSNVGSVDVEFCFLDISRKQRLNVECCLSERNSLLLLGDCSVSVEKLLECRGKTYKAFIESKEEIVGYLVFDFDLKLQTTPRYSRARPQEEN